MNLCWVLARIATVLVTSPLRSRGCSLPAGWPAVSQQRFEAHSCTVVRNLAKIPELNHSPRQLSSVPCLAVVHREGDFIATPKPEGAAARDTYGHLATNDIEAGSTTGAVRPVRLPLFSVSDCTVTPSQPPRAPATQY